MKSKFFQKLIFIAVITLSAIIISACNKKTGDAPKREVESVNEVTEEAVEESSNTNSEDDIEATDNTETEEVEYDENDEADREDEPWILHFVDAFGEEYEASINPNVPMHDYDMSAFIHDGDKLYYSGDSRYESRLGIDVSYHNGSIDWNKVKADGYDFVIIRAAYRGYGKSGSLNKDKKFDDYIKGAHDAGLEVGVYIFSQAINEDEALEEAQFVLNCIEGYDLELPVVYDPESILDDVARTDDVSGEQFTANTLVFCKAIEEAGYDAMVYSNMKWEAYQFDMSLTSMYPYWYADYEELPQTPYAFCMWQYTNTGHVSGVSGEVDIDIQLLKL